ncbi:glycosyl transferase group 1 family protein [Aphanothece hegewaldii CCALA 016]|uniref:Glycosyl transferase group 1 family protein n=1 Tax=Aphanothece hegewaldii CCALA 016 TaxID=2107694 RepID=A0A2T1LTL0_9CHRO|nr:glycosyltransferase [Aphanothece hegewaldii]PSF34266.1 glycosyl transferase group 1 family protein [Aphanothece hegewaldii CCALA 016]
MKIIIPIEFYRKGGVERVIISLVISLIKYVDQIILVLPNKEIPYFKSLLPESEKICYEDFQPLSFNLPLKILNFLGRDAIPFEKIAGAKAKIYLSNKTYQVKIQTKLNELIQKYQANYCIYGIINKINPPKVNASLSGIAYDLFWMFAPLTYSEEYRQNYNEPLEKWLKSADIIFTISEKTRDDILKVFPNSKYQKKLKPVPLSGYLVKSDENYIQNEQINTPSQTVQFYFPSSFGIYKDHLTLLKAGVILAQKNLNFKIILLGRETDGLIQGQLKLSQQSNTQEYADYINQCQELYNQHQAIFDKYFEGLGYCDYEKVEYLYQGSSCVIMTSQYEGFGLAVSEAIVRGLPVIASDLDVFKEQVNLYQCSDRVRLFPVGNVEKLAEYMEEFIKNPLPKLADAEIQERFSHWTWDTVAQAYINALQSIDKK